LVYRDPRRAAAAARTVGRSESPRIEIPPQTAPQTAPLHVLEALLETALCDKVKPAKRQDLNDFMKIVRDTRELQNVREVSLSKIVELLGPESIEEILSNLGFCKPSEATPHP
jgi:hypothetical protein